ncbi:hypothetical protein COEREDRAFT_83981 [Coemansia reversa NRRL 1564]|uniref:EH domain-containing protein n=1 Tax=Coemansia reversa (strain ATCC 12441 / NRRL 1564) TaxID=763665 RepID=A0A2G5B0X8_COERN|nr:hypothetical protein COEREDRAFT_83981 [Coemansia reversa NRRL 1564]|eukprot:PIA12659.1 hypothetical protein COEREDRAFT_83981 [Coemansia reversa NRRL 1564]
MQRYANSTHQRPWRPTLHEVQTYNYLFSLVDRQNKGSATQAAVFKLLKWSNLHQGYTQRIWQIATNGNNKQMTRREFYIAMKMVSLAQSGRSVCLANLGESTSLPALIGVDLSKAMEYSVAQSTKLRYTPQPTMELDDIISLARSNASNHSLSANENGNKDHRVSLTPPHSPVSTIMFLDDYVPPDNSGDTLSLLTPELHYENLTPISHPHGEVKAVASSKVTPQLRIDTKLTSNADTPFTAPIGAHSPLSTESITELLSKIDMMINSSHSASTLHCNSSNDTRFGSATSMDSNLIYKIAEMQEMCNTELAQNSQIVSQISSDERQLKKLNAQIDLTRKNIAYVAKQRTKLVDRLSNVERKQQSMQNYLRSAESESERCSKDIDQLDNKVFGMERRMVRMDRHANFQRQGLQRHSHVPQSCNQNASLTGRSADYRLSGESVLQRYQTAKRNRLSSVFRNPAAV